MTYQCGQIAGVTAGAVVLTLVSALVTLAGIKAAGQITTR